MKSYKFFRIQIAVYVTEQSQISTSYTMADAISSFFSAKGLGTDRVSGSIYIVQDLKEIEGFNGQVIEIVAH